MAFSYEAGSKLFRNGEFLALAEGAGRTYQDRRAQEPRLRVLIAHALAFVGQLDEAERLAELDRNGPSSPGIRSQSEVTLCLIQRRFGNHRAALAHAQAAVLLAQESNDTERKAWAQLHLLRLLIEIGPLDKALASLAEARKIVARAGSDDASAYLHICVSTLEGQNGRLDEARRHCDIAQALLQRGNNAWLAASCEINRGCIAWFSCQFDEASKWFEAGRKTALRIGHVYLTQAADICQAYTYLFTGDFERAERAFLAISTHAATNNATELGALEGLVRVYLASGRLGEADGVIANVNQREKQTKWNYDVRFAPITEARLLINKGRYDEAIELLNLAEQRFAAEGDVRLTVAVQLIYAQAVARKGDLAVTSQRIVRASELNVTAIRDLQAEFYYGCALATIDNPALKVCLRQRAARLWTSQGVVSVQHELDNAFAVRVPVDDDLTEEHASLGSVECVANSLASLHDVAHSLKLLAAEMAAAIRAMGCSTDVRVVESRARYLDQPGPQTLVVDLGIDRGLNISLVCAIPKTPSKAVVLADVVRLGRAAIELEQSRKAERNRAAVWPATPVEEQAGALFVAEEMQTLLTTARRIATTNVPVLITGETGTGKEVLARTIHAYSGRASATFLPFNCSSVPRDMLDSQLFGHRRGSFTGASENFLGVIRAANSGTLFLDEIGETTLEVQPKLLRFLDASEVHPIGELLPVKADVRVIAATNVDLDAFVTQGRFREDLFYRLNIVRLHVPPLRERRVEIPTLAHHYLQKHAHEYRKGDLRLAEETMEFLLLYRWPGNVRQLANEMRRMAVLAEAGAVLMPEHLSPDIAASRRTLPPSERVLEPTELVVRLDQPVPAAVQHLERTMIQFALRACGGRMEETAAMLGLSRKGLYLKRIRYGLEPPEGAPAADVA